MDWQERFEARLCEEISLKQVYPLASQPRIFLFGFDPLADDVDSEIETDLADRTQLSTTGPISESPLDHDTSLRADPSVSLPIPMHLGLLRPFSRHRSVGIRIQVVRQIVLAARVRPNLAIPR